MFITLKFNKQLSNVILVEVIVSVIDVPDIVYDLLSADFIKLIVEDNDKLEGVEKICSLYPYF